MNVTLESLKKLSPKTIYYGATTCWWTHDPSHLGIHPENGLPCDPRGGVLLQTQFVDNFLDTASQNPNHYGKHGIRTFLAAHHENTIELLGHPWCYKTWDEYNALLDKKI
jgi:hypothetical protein